MLIVSFLNAGRKGRMVISSQLAREYQLMQAHVAQRLEVPFKNIVIESVKTIGDR